MNKTIHIDQLSKLEIDQKIKERNHSKWLPLYHLSPPFGLLNDPNGLSYFNQTFNVFFQWYPGGPTHGLKHWMHLTSNDLINYQVMGVAIKPTTIDRDGAFSGTYANLNSGHKILYTSNKIENDQVVQKQIIADIQEQKIVNKQLLIDNIKYQPDQFRDPSMFAISGQEYIIVGAQTIGGEPVIAVYKYINQQAIWIGELSIQLGQNYHMIECPQIMKIDNMYVIIASPQGLENGEYNYQNKFNVVYATFTDIDFERMKFVNLSEFKEFDFGHDFYAPQIFNAQQQHIMYGWAGCGKSKYPEQLDGWMNVFTMPRTIELKNNELIQKPHESVYKLTEHFATINQKQYRHNTKSFTIKCNLYSGQKIVFGCEESSLLIYEQAGYLILDRSKSKDKIVSLHSDVRRCKLNSNALEIFIDNSIIEIFINDYRNTMTSRIYVEQINHIEISNLFEIANIKPINLKYEVNNFE